MTAPPEIEPSVPWLGTPSMARVSGSPSASVHVSGTETAAPTAVRRDTSSQLGLRVIVIAAVAGADPATPSLARYVNESSPW